VGVKRPQIEAIRVISYSGKLVGMLPQGVFFFINGPTFDAICIGLALVWCLVIVWWLDSMC
jgi:hypothetical protein